MWSLFRYSRKQEYSSMWRLRHFVCALRAWSCFVWTSYQARNCRLSVQYSAILTSSVTKIIRQLIHNKQLRSKGYTNGVWSRDSGEFTAAVTRGLRGTNRNSHFPAPPPKCNTVTFISLREYRGYKQRHAEPNNTHPSGSHLVNHRYLAANELPFLGWCVESRIPVWLPHRRVVPVGHVLLTSSLHVGCEAAGSSWKKQVQE